MSAAAPGPGAPEPGPLVEWYRRCARDLPWRRPGTGPYAVLVCEVMSQQTPVARVEPVWREWMRRWPDPAALAGAPTAQVLRVWGRLGYPRRALRLIEAARAVVAEHGGTLPEGYEELLALPGVGPYTAGAVRAFAHGRRALALDTNARRVLARGGRDGAAAAEPGPGGAGAGRGPASARRRRGRPVVGGRHGAGGAGVHGGGPALRGVPVAGALRLGGGRPSPR